MTQDKDSWNDLETYSPTPITNGTHKYAEKAEVMIWAFADGNDDVKVWDLVSSSLHYVEPLSGEWVEEPLMEGVLPAELYTMLRDPEYLVWFQNGGMFDFVVLHHAMPEVLALIPQERRRDTMIQAFSHALPGALEKLGAALKLNESDKKQAIGKQLVRLFCMPQNDAFFEKYGTRRATRKTHPKEWLQFVQYAGGDITTMRAVHRKIPKWNYRGKQIDLWHLDMRINNRGFLVDQDLARGAIEATTLAKAEFAKRTKKLTNYNAETGEGVEDTGKRDKLLSYILGAYGVELPDMRADTLERRLQDEDLPDIVKELLKIRLQASMNSVSKYRTLLKGVSSDGRLRGCAQFRGAGRTGRWAHRMFQPGNLPRPSIPHSLIAAGIGVARHDVEHLHLVVGDMIMQWASSAIRGCIVAPKGKLLGVADLSNIEGRVAAWMAGEDWKLDAFRRFDAGDGFDLYILAYAMSFNVPPASVPKKGPERQIGKVEELMFQYGGGVGAWLTGAATYGIDLDRMTEQVYPVLPEWSVEDAAHYLQFLYSKADEAHARAVRKHKGDATEIAKADAKRDVDKVKARMGLSDKVFITCDAIKRLWRKAHPAISSYWKELEDTVRQAVADPGVTYNCRKVKIRRSGSWLRIGLPSGRELTYPQIQVSESGEISYVGPNTYTRNWERVKTYGGKLFENIVQAVACDQLAECFGPIEDDGFEIVLHVHDEVVAEFPEGHPTLNADRLSELMCTDLYWNRGLPLAAAGFSTDRYQKE